VSSVLTLHYSMLAVTFQTKVTWSASSIWRSPSGFWNNTDSSV